MIREKSVGIFNSSSARRETTPGHQLNMLAGPWVQAVCVSSAGGGPVMRRLRSAALLLPLLIPLAAFAEPTRLFDPPRADNSPTAFACTSETLASGAECVFEGKVDASNAAEAPARLRGMASATCDAALKSAAADDAKVLRDGCMARVQAAADRCAPQGAVVDSAGRFTSQGKSCYRALSEARNQSASLANAAPNCCECLARNHCAGAGEGCVASAARSNLKASCGSDACDAACAELLFSAPGPVARSSSSARSKHAK
jgi:hypothetical protein